MRATATSRTRGGPFRGADVRQMVIEGEIVAAPPHVPRPAPANRNEAFQGEPRVRYVRRRRRLWNVAMRAAAPTLASALFLLFRIAARALAAKDALKAQTR